MIIMPLVCLLISPLIEFLIETWTYLEGNQVYNYILLLWLLANNMFQKAFKA